MSYKTYLVGRSSECDIVLDDSRVSRMHAELVVTASGRAHVTDRRSTGGTEVLRGGQWARIERQDFVEMSDRLRFGGAVEISVRELVAKAGR